MNASEERKRRDREAARKSRARKKEEVNDLLSEIEKLKVENNALKRDAQRKDTHFLQDLRTHLVERLKTHLASSADHQTIVRTLDNTRVVKWAQVSTVRRCVEELSKIVRPLAEEEVCLYFVRLFMASQDPSLAVDSSIGPFPPSERATEHLENVFGDVSVTSETKEQFLKLAHEIYGPMHEFQSLLGKLRKMVLELTAMANKFEDTSSVVLPGVAKMMSSVLTPLQKATYFAELGNLQDHFPDLFGDQMAAQLRQIIQSSQERYENCTSPSITSIVNTSPTSLTSAFPEMSSLKFPSTWSGCPLKLSALELANVLASVELGYSVLPATGLSTHPTSMQTSHDHNKRSRNETSSDHLQSSTNDHVNLVVPSEDTPTIPIQPSRIVVPSVTEQPPSASSQPRSAPSSHVTTGPMTPTDTFPLLPQAISQERSTIFSSQTPFAFLPTRQTTGLNPASLLQVPSYLHTRQPEMLYQPVSFHTGPIGPYSSSAVPRYISQLPQAYQQFLPLHFPTSDSGWSSSQQYPQSGNPPLRYMQMPQGQATDTVETPQSEFSDLVDYLQAGQV